MADAWILAATRNAGRGVTLTILIGSVDAINHAIPTRDEPASSLGALTQAGLLEVSGNRFKPTRAGEAVLRQWKGGMLGWIESLPPHLNTMPRPRNDYPITDDEVQAAYRAYVKRTRL